jgi:hypothetical protein
LRSKRAAQQTTGQVNPEGGDHRTTAQFAQWSRQALLNNVSKGSLEEKFPQAEQGKARDKAAAYFGVS